jgi:hypothetical protein
MMKIRHAALALVAVVLVAGCGLAPQPPTKLPTVSSFNECPGVGASGHITGDPADPRLAWLAEDSGGRREVIWPPGYTARFTPKLEILDENGAVAFRDGDRVRGGCVTGPDGQGPLLIAAGF